MSTRIHTVTVIMTTAMSACRKGLTAICTLTQRWYTSIRMYLICTMGISTETGECFVGERRFFSR
jgi:hypothetical protein